jgi:hypothetical protein
MSQERACFPADVGTCISARNGAELILLFERTGRSSLLPEGVGRYTRNPSLLKGFSLAI